MPDETMTARQATAFVRDFLTFRPRAAMLTCALVAAGSLAEGLGLVLIIPLLDLAAGPGMAEAGPAGFWGAALAWTGVSTRLGRIAIVLGCFVALMLARGIVTALRQTAVTRLELDFVATAQIRLVDRLGQAPWQAVVGLRHARVNRILGSDMLRIGQAATGLLQSAVAIITLAIQLGIALLLDARLTLVALLLVALGMLLSAPLYRAARKLGDAMTEVDLNLLNEVGQFLGALKLAVSQNLAGPFRADFTETVRSGVAAELAYVARANRTRMQMTVAGVVVASGTAFFGLGLLGVAAPTLVALLLLLSRMTAPAQALQSQAIELVRALPAYEQLQMLERELEADRAMLTDAPLPPLEHLAFDRVAYHHVAAAADESAPAGLNGLSLDLRRGEFLGIAGPSGAGKTTFADLLVGLYAPQSGAIRLNGHPVSLAAHRTWRDRLAYVAQDPFMRHASVRENLLWGNSGASPGAMERALAIAGADALVARLPQGLDTLVGERGSLISGGERQRLALARALLRAPQLLILDEATNAIDIAAERAILERLAAALPNVAIVMIAHRLESLHLCDRVIWLKDGRVAAEGGDMDERCDPPGSRGPDAGAGETGGRHG